MVDEVEEFVKGMAEKATNSSVSLDPMGGGVERTWAKRLTDRLTPEQVEEFECWELLRASKQGVRDFFEEVDDARRQADRDLRVVMRACKEFQVILAEKVPSRPNLDKNTQYWLKVVFEGVGMLAESAKEFKGKLR